MTLLLEPILCQTASASATPPLSVRIVWVVSLLQLGTPAGAMNFDKDGKPQILTKFMDNYMQSKVGCAWLADEFAKCLGDKGILSVVSGFGPQYLIGSLLGYRVSTPG
jgi:retinol dehydrogenase-12